MSDGLRWQAYVVAEIFDMRHVFLQCSKDATVSFFSGEQCSWFLVLGSWFLVLGSSYVGSGQLLMTLVFLLAFLDSFD